MTQTTSKRCKRRNEIADSLIFKQAQTQTNIARQWPHCRRNDIADKIPTMCAVEKSV
jgi:hypothetical protein